MNHLLATALSAVRRGALLVDDVSVPPAAKAVRLSDTDVQADELWRFPGAGVLDLAVLGSPRSARDLYRVLCGTERLVAPGGAILILPYPVTAVAPVENRWEATEAFLGVYPEWERQLHQRENVIELRRGARKGTVPQQPPRAASGASGKIVVSLSLFGTGGYWDYAPAFVRAHLALFPGYELRIHHDERLYRAPYGGALVGLAQRGLLTLVEVPSHPGQGKCERMLHRLLPAWDADVDVVFARDIDALPTWSERACDEEFLAGVRAGEVDAGTQHWNSAHAGMMGGLCAFKAEALRAFAPTFEAFLARAGFSDERWAQHGADQDYLNAKVVLGMRVFEHSVFVYHGEDGKRLVRQPSDWGNGGPHNFSVRFVTEVPQFDDPTAPAHNRVRERSNELINYPGAAGYSIDKAIEFYDEPGNCPVIDQIRDAEREAGWTR